MNMRHLLCLCSLIWASVSASDRIVAPDWTLESAEGNTVRLSERTGNRATVLFFWATWCPYCKALMPHLQSIRLEHGDAVEILAINIMEDGDPVKFIEDAGYDFVLLMDGDDVAAAYGITGTPGVLVLDGDRGVHFDLRRLAPFVLPTDKPLSHRQKAAYQAPYWAAEIRKSIDALR